MDEKYPRLVQPAKDNHYLIHKVSKAWIDENGVLRFRYEDGSGKELAQGPFYPGYVNNSVPLAAKELSKYGLQEADDVKYVIAYHNGAFPTGMPCFLLKRLEDIPARYL
jgi:hypothetical protein